MSWSRETRWRQGCICLSEAFTHLDIPNSENFPFCMTISHDCDIANDDLMSEPIVEFVLGRIVSVKQGNNEFAKNPRLLHIDAYNGGSTVFFEFHASKKIFINKDKLFGIEPDNQICFDQKGLSIIQDWLSARYKRQAFPDNFDKRFRPIADILREYGKKYAAGIVGYWLDYSPRNDEIIKEEPYELWLFIIYSADKEDYEIFAKMCAEKIKKDFPKLMSKLSEIGTLDLRACEAISEDEFTIHDARNSISYRLEYLSHRIDPPGPVA